MNARAFAQRICQTLRSKGHQAYFVGGCVRDILLHREPADYDVATDATPERVEQIFPNSLTVGAKFGVVVVVQEPEAGESSERRPVTVEVATYRSDVGYSDGRHPDKVVYSSTPQEDVRRRDFTINGLLLDPETNEVLDFVGGRDDLRAGIMRAIGQPEQRFREDKLRMLRAVRFAARFGYTIEPETLRAIQKLAPEIGQVSAERLRDELTKLLGVCYCTTWASLQRLRHLRARTGASVSTGMWMSAPSWHRRSANACAFQMTIPRISRRWWPITCDSRTCRR
jgi:poly(A) polymerase